MLEILEAKDLTPYAAYETPGVSLHAVESMAAGVCNGFAVFSYEADRVTHCIVQGHAPRHRPGGISLCDRAAAEAASL